jgi:cation diffusion facilitator CzcD-associated flavoprotein CzcO
VAVEMAWSPRIAIIGVGISGIAAVVKLRRAGYTRLTVFEKADRVGGTWRENTYPGIRCDVPARWYSFSFAPNPDWSQRCAPGAEIQAYLEQTAERFDVLSAVRFNTAVEALEYIAPYWRLRTCHREILEFDIVISATGVLHHPVVPPLSGLNTFTGPLFHSARWDHSVSLRGKRVGVIGTGSTACQIVGAIAEQVGQLSLFQRTPQWVMPQPQKTYSSLNKCLYRAFPLLFSLSRRFWQAYISITIGRATVGNKGMQGLIDFLARRHLRQEIADPALREKLTPDYLVTCKRLIYASDFYPAMCSPNASLVTDGIDRIDANGVWTCDGVHHPLDVLVMATGFDTKRFILPTRVSGENGVDLGAFWDGVPRAHRAVCVPGFPNFWMLEGPTGPIGNFSLIAISEAQVDYLIQCLDEMKQRKASSIAPTAAAFAHYNTAIAKAALKTSWYTGGCQSWYLDKSGLPNLYPWRAEQYFTEISRPDFNEFNFA